MQPPLVHRQPQTACRSSAALTWSSEKCPNRAVAGAPHHQYKAGTTLSIWLASGWAWLLMWNLLDGIHGAWGEENEAVSPATVVHCERELTIEV